MTTSAALTLITLVNGGYAQARPILNHVRRQSCVHMIELVMVTPSRTQFQADEAELAVFHSYQIVEMDVRRSTPEARAAGVRQAHAPIVAFVEEHSFPAPGWAEALIQAHQGPWAAVGPVIANANPDSLVSWANLAIEYGPWLDHTPAGVRDHLPGHNSSYKRDVLLAYGERLPAMFDAESVLHWDLRAQGYQLYLEPRARTYHINISAFMPSLILRFYGGRLFAAARSRQWTWPRRLLYLAAGQLIPVVRLIRTARWLLQPGRPGHRLPRLLPVIALFLIVDGIGEMLGYALGMGSAMSTISDMEFDRQRYLTPTDRQGGGPAHRHLGTQHADA